MSARGLIVLCGALVLAGCSHSPNPVAVPVPLPTDVGERVVVLPVPDPVDDDKDAVTSHVKRPAAPKSPGDPSAGAVVAGSSTSAPALPDTAQTASVVPQLSAQEAKELEKSSREQIDEATQKLATLDPAKLDPDKQRKFEIAQGFLKDAGDARKQQDWMRASQLATKARVLADELTAH